MSMSALDPGDACREGARVIGLLRLLRGWTGGFGPGFVPEVAEMAALALTSAAPDAPAAVLLPPAMQVVWAQAIDDRFDVAATSLAEVNRIVSRCQLVARGAMPDPEVATEVALASLTGTLSQCAGWGPLRAVWLDRLDRMLAACRFEWLAGQQLSDTGAGPGVDAYLAQHHSVGAGPVCLAWWMSAADPRVLSHLDLLLAAADELEIAIRLANDQCSADRETQHERHGVNALALGATGDWIEQRIQHHLAAGRDLLAPLSGTLPAAREMAWIAGWLVGLYRLTEARCDPGRQLEAV